MDVLIVGSGGRESALAHYLLASPGCRHVYVAPGNGGTATTSPRIHNVVEPDIVDFAVRAGIGLVVVGPEVALAEGIADSLRLVGVPCFGPGAEGARIESSKAWAKGFMLRNSIPTAAHAVCTSMLEIDAYLVAHPGRVVVKASGLAAGKGVIMAADSKTARAAAESILVDHVFGSAGDEVVMEEWLDGEEVSVLAFTDGKTVAIMPPAQDHKRAYEFNRGPNTGGMGAFAPSPLVSSRALAYIRDNVMQATIDGLAREGIPYCGVLFAGVMLCSDGPRVLEFNCRLGDPETQVLLPLLETDLLTVLKACAAGTLVPADVKWFPGQFAATVVTVAEGYPGAPRKGDSIELEAMPQGVNVFHAGTALTDAKTLVTSGGRVLSVSATGTSLGSAIRSAYSGAERVRYTGGWYRRDIGGVFTRPLAASQPLRVAVIGSTRGTDLVPILAAIDAGDLPGVSISLVLSNKADAGILDKAKAAGIEFKAIPSAGRPNQDFEADVINELVRKKIDIILMIGFMKIVSPAFVDRFAWRILNVHPSLLPAFAGGMDANVHAAVLAAGVPTTGCTVHFVSAQVDGGAILVQKACAVAKDETVDSLKAKVQALEGEALIVALKLFADECSSGILHMLRSCGESWEAVSGLLPKGRLPVKAAEASVPGRPLTYAAAGVDIDAGDALVENIKPLAKSTARVGADADLGGFGGLFDLAAAGYKDPLLVASTDGVGTKLRLAIQFNMHDTVGIDLVAMSVNDLIVQGAEPLCFLDYYASGKLNVADATSVVAGIAEGCRQAGCALVGGETAEMSSMYAPGDYDLAGFAVGAVERSKVLPDLAAMKAGDVLLGVASSGLHSNGFSLVRKVLETYSIDASLAPPFVGSKYSTLAQELMTPTTIYVKSLLPCLKGATPSIKAMAHITGGGLPDNLPRVLPEHLQATVDMQAWPMPPVFTWLAGIGSGIPPAEMARTFNCGIGMVLVVACEAVPGVMESIARNGQEVYVIGAMEDRNNRTSAQVNLVHLDTVFRR